MKIVIVGDGKVGFALAEQLSREGNDIVIIDKNADALERAADKLDVMCISGNGVTSEVLQEAGVKTADLLIAATTNDEMNMICCVMAKKIGAKYTVARIRDYEYFKDTEILRGHLGIDKTINPEYSSALKIARQLRFPAAANIEAFASDRVEMVEYKVEEDDKLIGQKLKDLKNVIPSGVLFAVVKRGDSVFIPNGEYLVEKGDSIHIIGEPYSNTKFFVKQGKSNVKVKEVLVGGGGRISLYLNHLLTDLNMKMEIIEISKEKCGRLNQILDNTLIINGDCTDQELLESENPEETDAYIALTGRDEDNIISALMAKQKGIPKVIVKVDKMNDVSVIHDIGIDSVISPKAIAADEIVRYVRALRNTEGISVEKLYTLLNGEVEALEFILTSTENYLDIPLCNLEFKKGVLIGSIVRKNKIIIPKGDEKLLQGDKIIVILSGKYKPTDFNQILSAVHNE